MHVLFASAFLVAFAVIMLVLILVKRVSLRDGAILFAIVALLYWLFSAGGLR